MTSKVKSNSVAVLTPEALWVILSGSVGLVKVIQDVSMFVTLWVTEGQV